VPEERRGGDRVSTGDLKGGRERRKEIGEA